ncbi:15554_t:CDS:2 [Rhizophagus irregularis]|nr:15554_t:CDS:2 [Rhizophagus irregularis]
MPARIISYTNFNDDGFLIRSDKWMADSNQIGYNGDGYSLIETLSLTSLLSNSQYAITTNQKIIDQSSQANDSQLINLFINECKTLFIRIRKPTPQLVLALVRKCINYLGVTTYNALDVKKRMWLVFNMKNSTL